MSERVVIDELGAQGDGIAQTPAGPLYVPFTLPGETVLAEIRAKGRAALRTVETASSQRQEPACRHFGECGGCAVQHVAPEAYAAWKRAKVVRALQSRSLEAEVAPLVTCPPNSRRRVTLTARTLGNRILLGYNAAQSHHLIDIEECPIAAPEIVAALEDMRVLARILAPRNKPLRLAVTATATGLDIAVGAAGRLEEKRRQKAVECALAGRFARLSFDGEVLVECEKPVVQFGDVPVAVPPGGFLQATAHAEKTMAAHILRHLDGAKNVADLFAGSGTFTLRLARHSRVHAVEGDAAALAALSHAARTAPGLKPVSSEKRDLFHRPLLPRELDAFDGLVFDPPRAGAEAQSQQIARSKVRRVAAISCNPGTLARDLAILVEGGYRIAEVTPIDQFLWSPHVEVVALLERSGKRPSSP
ncbi:class I SAM-dependent RNA methyltransferase [Chelativorans sp. YIM 93263]|uniref:class I SAM-dependent RNA methyltransferase n=1 Tax=Chelativorans sp. YIM 93263 TaxID=2906648 RepID=UPI002379CEDF|nr:class I SAM-dependent RNA methyltransferase [Chelativorans sp. YIM 93263]